MTAALALFLFLAVLVCAVIAALGYVVLTLPSLPL